MTFSKCQKIGGYKMKRKIIAIILVVCSLCSFASCGTDKGEVYENVAFQDLKTFTEITDIVLNSTTEENTHETIFSYVSFENVEQKINDYKTYLIESGFTMVSDLDDKDVIFELDEKRIEISLENTDAGTSINITMPCDEATNEIRRDAKYEELLMAVEEEDWDDVYDITHQFSDDELQNFKEVKAYRMFSLAMDPYKKNIFGVAKDLFEDYLEFQPEDKLGAKTYIKECNDKLSKYNGTYVGKSFTGLLEYYMFIKDGKVEFDFKDGYKQGESVYYLEELQVSEVDENTVLLKVVDYSFYDGDVDYRKTLVQLDDGGMLVYDFKWDILQGRVDTSTFAGEYTKISDDAPKAKNTSF